MVVLPADVVSRYPRFSLYNSPYTAHDRGAAVDLYPDNADDDAPSPVAGEVVDVRTVRAPPKPYAAESDHLIVVDVGDHLARMLHVDPAVEPGDEVAVGDSLGTMVRSGFFAPWVANHIHLGFREHDTNPVRASGSLRLDVDVPVEPVPWDGVGTVAETGDTWVLLDAPAHPASGEYFAGIAGSAGVLDGGMPHYDAGGVLGGVDGPVSFLGANLGTVAGRDVAWNDLAVRANGTPVTGLSFFLGRDWLGAKLVTPDWSAAVGDRVEVTVESTADARDH
ncbi:hypothetical protein ACFQH6_02360 [Halobacteriaceae archaeon GCM10025711]